MLQPLCLSFIVSYYLKSSVLYLPRLVRNIILIQDLKLTDSILFQEQELITENSTLGLRDLKFGIRLGNLFNQ